MTVNHRIDAYEWSTDKLTILSHSIKLEMLWELMRLYDWRIITYISSFPVLNDRKGSWPLPHGGHEEMSPVYDSNRKLIIHSYISSCHGNVGKLWM